MTLVTLAGIGILVLVFIAVLLIVAALDKADARKNNWLDRLWK